MNGMIDAALEAQTARMQPRTFDEWIMRNMGRFLGVVGGALGWG